jgi:DnaJ-class molecular chaperone
MTCYDLLGVPGNATEGQIKSAWRVLAQQHHPDKGGDPELFNNYRKAYEEALPMVDVPTPSGLCDVCRGTGHQYIMHGWLKVPISCVECDGSGKL